jgi:hypothetical protein
VQVDLIEKPPVISPPQIIKPVEEEKKSGDEGPPVLEAFKITDWNAV